MHLQSSLHSGIAQCCWKERQMQRINLLPPKFSLSFFFLVSFNTYSHPVEFFLWTKCLCTNVFILFPANFSLRMHYCVSWHSTSANSDPPHHCQNTPHWSFSWVHTLYLPKWISAIDPEIKSVKLVWGIHFWFWAETFRAADQKVSKDYFKPVFMLCI